MRKQLIYTFYIFVLLALVTRLYSCKPEETPPSNSNTNNWPKDWYVPQEVLDYFYFRPGSFWVYENDKTGKKDTVNVTESTKKWVNSPNGERYELAKTVLYSSSENYYYSYYESMQGASNCIKNGSNHPCHGVLCSKYKPGDVLGESFAWVYPFQKGFEGPGDFSLENSTFKITEVLDSLTIMDSVYYKIVKINITNALVYYRKDIELIWAKDVGIIKRKNITDNENWNLIYSNIFK